MADYRIRIKETLQLILILGFAPALSAGLWWGYARFGDFSVLKAPQLLLAFIIISGAMIKLIYSRDESFWLTWALMFSYAIYGFSVFLCTFASIYYQVSQDHNGACMYNPLSGTESLPLSRIDSFYFTVTTFTTTGYGDIRPVTAQCRLLVSLQMLIGFLLVAVLVALIVSRIATVLSHRP